MDKTPALMRKLGYQFSDMGLLQLALTHRSKGSKNYERLEFLGDSILGFVIADWLYHQYAKMAEGKLSRMRSTLVRRESLAQVARELNLSDHLILGEGELKSGGFNRASILSDTVESIIGAIYLDSSLVEAKQFVERNFKTQFELLSEQSSFKDPKSQLQEYMQKQGLDLPQYEIIDTSGQQHMQTFTVECTLPGELGSTRATAASRRLAEQDSAKVILDSLQNKPVIENKKKSKRAQK